MKKYKMIFDKAKKTNQIIEIATNQVIGSISSKKKASEFYRFLNRGGAFDGFTPHFFLIDVKGLLK